MPDSPRSERTPRLAVRLIELTLRLFPDEFLSRFEESMLDSFESGYAARRGRRWSQFGFIARSWFSLAVAGVRERLSPTYEDTQRHETGTKRRWVEVMGIFMRDIGYALRGLLRRPGFAAVAILTLALGAGANTAMFSVVNGVLLRPLPYPDSEGIISVSSDWSGERSSMSYPDIVDLRERSPAIETLVGVNETNQTLTGMGEAEMIPLTRLTEGLLETFRLAPYLGRDIRRDDFGVNGARIALVSYGFWRDRLGASPDAIGRTFQLNGYTYEVIGVAPPEFDYPAASLMWIPRSGDFIEGCGRGCHTMVAIGRLAGGTSVATAQAEAAQVADRLREAFPGTNLEKDFLVESLQDRLVGSVSQALNLMLGAVGLVLLIACVNVANLLLVRASARNGEMAVRKALGASRRRLLAMSLMESGVLALVGGALGVVIAVAVLEALPLVAGGSIPRLEQVTVDLRALAFTFTMMVGVTFLFGLAPALAGSRANIGVGLHGRGDGGGRGQSRLRAWLLAGEVALSTTLLIGAGLLMRTFQELYAVDPGFETEDILRFNLSLPSVSYGTLEEVRLFYRTLEERIAQVPGVESVGSGWGPPLGRGNASGTVYVEGRPDPRTEDEISPYVRPVGPGFMQTMGIQVARGRGFDRADDDPNSEPVVLINEELARQLFPDEEPIGKQIRLGVSLGYTLPISRIVGVLPELRNRSLTERPLPEVWMPHGQYGPNGMTVTMRVAQGSTNVISQVRRIVREMDASLPVYRVETMEDAVARQVAPTRFYMILAGAFAVLAAALAAVGLYGVAAYAASRRTREIGLRMALGAPRAGISKLVLGQGLRPAGWGLAVGLVLAYFGARILEVVLYGVEPRDPVTFAGVAMLLIVVATVATIVPARRASRINPVVALRAE